MKVRYIATGGMSLLTIFLLAGCGNNSGWVNTTTNTVNTTSTTVSNQTASTAPVSEARTIAAPVLIHAGEPANIYDLKSGGQFSVSNNGSFALTPPNGPYKTIYGMLQRQDTKDGFTLTSIAGSIEFEQNGKLVKGNGTLTASFIKQNGKWQGAATFKSQSYSVIVKDESTVPSVATAVNAVRQDLLDKNYKDMYLHYLDPFVAAQINYQQFAADFPSNIVITDIQLMGPPIYQGNPPLITADQQVKVSFTKSGNVSSNFDTWVFSLDNGKWMYEGGQ